MKKRVVKKSQVLKEGYLKGLSKACNIITEMIAKSQGFDDDTIPISTTTSGKPGADAESSQKRLTLELFQAIKKLQFSRVKQLLNQGARVDYEIESNDIENGLAIHQAAKTGNLDMIKLILEQDPSLVDKCESISGDTPLLILLLYFENDETYSAVKFLLDNGANPNTRNSVDRYSPLHAAAASDLKCCELLLSYGARVNALDYDGATPLNWAYKYGANSDVSKRIVELLKSHGAVTTK